MYCPSCGNQNLVELNYCSRCGANLALPTAQMQYRCYGAAQTSAAEHRVRNYDPRWAQHHY